MIDNFWTKLNEIYQTRIIGYFDALYQNPIKLIAVVLDILIVLYLAYKTIKLSRKTRAWQLLKGIILLIIVTWVSSVLRLNILNYILTSFMTYGVIILIVIFQPELRRALEQLGTNKLSRFFGMDKDIETRTRENIYKIVIATLELAKKKTGALIVIERDIKIKDIIDTGIMIRGEISPQLLVNIFEPKTPLHDGAVIISESQIMAAACMLPLASDKDIAKELGTRHRAGIGISKESDAIAVIVSEETGKISIARNGTLIADLNEESLKKILIKNIITDRFNIQRKTRKRKVILKKKK